MKMRSVLLAGVLGIAGYLVGCGGAPEVVDDKAPDLSTLLTPGEAKLFHEWKKVYSVVNAGAGLQRSHVGFADRRFTIENQDGVLFILDRTHEVRGFLLPEGRAYLAEQGPDEPNRYRNLGLTGQDMGIKKILDVPGSIELERLETASNVPEGQ